MHDFGGLTLTGSEDLLWPSDAEVDGAASPEDEAVADGLPFEAGVAVAEAPDEVKSDPAPLDATAEGAESSVVAAASPQ